MQEVQNQIDQLVSFYDTQRNENDGDLRPLLMDPSLENIKPLIKKIQGLNQIILQKYSELLPYQDGDTPPPQKLDEYLSDQMYSLSKFLKDAYLDLDAQIKGALLLYNLSQLRNLLRTISSEIMFVSRCINTSVKELSFLKNELEQFLDVLKAIEKDTTVKISQKMQQTLGLSLGSLFKKQMGAGKKDEELKKQETTVTSSKKKKKKKGDDGGAEGEDDDPEENAVTQKGFTPVIAQQKKKEKKKDPVHFTIRKTTTQLNKYSDAQYDYYDEKRIICRSIYEDFEEDLKKNKHLFLKNVSKNQVVNKVEHKEYLNLSNPQLIKNYIEKNGYNYNEIEQISKIAQGGEAQVLRLKVIQPVETIVKIPIPQEDSKSTGQALYSILMESHLLKLIAHKDYIAEILEEIIEYNQVDKNVYGYVVIVEQAQNDLSDILSFWNDRVQSQDRQENFSLEKLLYFCLKAMEAMNYVHSKDVYFGDMKPQNLLVFRDLTVKLGDFGVSVKFPPQYKPDTIVQLKGLTVQYSKEDIVNNFSEGQFTVTQVIENDYYSLWKTFDLIYQENIEKIPTDCYFYQMLQDLQQLSNNAFGLKEVLRKWKRIIANDKSLIIALCQQMLQEDKIKAIPNMLKLSKYKEIFTKIFKQFEKEENEQFTYVQEKQYQEIAEDAAKPEIFDIIDNQFQDIYTNIDLSVDGLIEDFDIYIQQLLQYKEPLDHSFYKEKIFFQFRNLYYIKNEVIGNIQWENILSIQQEKEKSIQEKFIENLEEFKRFCIFYSFTAKKSDESKLLKIIQHTEALNQDELEAQLMLNYIKTYYLYDDDTARFDKIQSFARKCILIAQQLPQLSQQVIEGIILWAINGLITKNIQNHKEFLAIISLVKNFKDYKRTTYKAFYSKMYQAKALAEIQFLPLSKDQCIRYFQKERALYSKFYGEQGTDMSRNAYHLYDSYKNLPYSKASLYYLKKIAIYSEKSKKIQYSFQLAQYYKLRNKKEELIESLKQFQKIDQALYFILINYYGVPNEISKPEKIQSIQNLRSLEQFKKLKSQYFDENEIFQKGLLQLFGKKKKSYEKIYKYQKQWAEDLDFKDIDTQFNIKKFLLKRPELKELYDKINNNQNQKIQVDINYSKLCSYSGEIQNWKFNGEGKLTFLDGRIYEGTFLANKYNGQGKLLYPNGTCQQGTFVNGKFLKQEKTKIQGQSKDFYQGQKVNGRYQGKGTLIKINGDVFDGDFVNGKFFSGQIHFQNGDIYIGLLKDGKEYDGEATLKKSTGEVFQGKFQNGIFISGYIIKVEENNDKYEGYYSNEKYNGMGTLVKENGEKFIGEFQNGTYYGFGTLYLTNGERYTGQFYGDGDCLQGIKVINGKYHGQGFLRKYENGIQYEGEFDNGEFKKGTVKSNPKMASEEKYDGEIIDDKYHGKGRLIKDKQFVYEGEFLNGKFNGFGELKLENGEKYSGQFLNGIFLEGIDFNGGKYHGQGILRKDNGDRYEGIFENGEFKEGTCAIENYQGDIKNYKKTGFGKFQQQNGDVYEGGWQDDEYSGRGKIIYSDGTIYEGDFQNGQFNGQGTLIKNDGEKYEGFFKSNLYHGKGRQTLPNGEIFDAEFSEGVYLSGICLIDGKYNGSGLLIKPNGDRFEGLYENGIFKSGKAKFRFENGNFEGEIKDDKICGFGIYKKDENFCTYEGEWADNNYEGKGKLQFINGQKYDGNFSKGCYDGYGILQFEKIDKAKKIKIVKYEGEFKQGAYHGKGIQFYEKGESYEGTFVKGEVTGPGTFVQKNGKRFDGEFQENQFLSGLTYKDNNKLFGTGFLMKDNGDQCEGEFEKGILKKGYAIWSEYEGEIKDDQKDGYGKATPENGDYYIGYWKKNKYNGKGILISEQSTKLVDGFFVSGELQGQGFIKWQNGDKYEGAFASNKQNGQGILTLIKGERYEGVFVNNDFVEGILVNNGRYHGKGTLRKENGDKYYGQFDNNVFVEGRSETSQYQGDIRNDKRHGEGTYKTPNGTYTGSFQNNIFNGQGVFTKHDGYKIDGKYVDGKVVGKTFIETPQKNQIEVFIQDGIFKKNGSIQFANGFRFEGEYVGDFFKINLKTEIFENENLDMNEYSELIRQEMAAAQNCITQMQKRQIFEDSLILTNDQDIFLFYEWLPGYKSKLLYRASQDGFKAQDFHQNCDRQKNTVAIIKSQSGKIFGGYTTQKWASYGSYQRDPDAFLFSVTNGQKLKAVKSLENAIYGGSSYGPTFGGGHDLYVCNDSDTSNSSYTNLGSTYEVPNGTTYGSDDAKSFLAGSYNFMTEDIEVYLVSKGDENEKEKDKDKGKEFDLLSLL